MLRHSRATNVSGPPSISARARAAGAPCPSLAASPEEEKEEGEEIRLGTSGGKKFEHEKPMKSAHCGHEVCAPSLTAGRKRTCARRAGLIVTFLLPPINTVTRMLIAPLMRQSTFTNTLMQINGKGGTLRLLTALTTNDSRRHSRTAWPSTPPPSAF